MRATATNPITPDFFRFLKRLARNNRREWFREHQFEYEQDVRDPALTLVEALAKPLRKISAHYVADPSRLGGSLLRIQRDVRFTRDKSPYKDYIGIQLRHESATRLDRAPQFALNLAPKNTYFEVGFWNPPAPRAQAVRLAILENTKGWKRAVYGARVREVELESQGRLRKRLPRDMATDLDPDHPLVLDLRRRDFVLRTYLDADEATGEGFVERLDHLMRRGAPFLRFLCDANGWEC